MTLTVTLTRMLLIATGPYVSLFGSAAGSALIAQRLGIVALPVELPTHPWPAVIVTLKNRTQSPVVERTSSKCSRRCEDLLGLGGHNGLDFYIPNCALLCH